jgi:L-seryl-tRNA(Ser) seleniumtransferase
MDALLRSDPARRGAVRFGRATVKHAIQRTLDDIRTADPDGAEDRSDAEILAAALRRAARDHLGLGAVINATGVVLHTGLGRAPLPLAAARAAARAARGYVDLEVDRETGARGRRTARAESQLTALTGAEDALVVNNNAGALLLSLAALAHGKDVLVSRGELIEIGGEFRLPDIMAASGARLLEVGTTNRTRAGDYERALGRRTGLILKVHPSNYRVTGFTATPPLAKLAEIGRTARVPVLFDAGSGLLERYPEVPDEEPAVTEAVAAGADLVTFSGDKLLGGPQAGLVVGRAGIIDRLRRHPLARALRLDKMTVAALEAVLRLYATGRRQDLPLWALLSAPQATIRGRAKAIASVFRGASVRDAESAVGGGSLPGYALPSAEMVLPTREPEAMAARLRLGRPPVFCRVGRDEVAFDLRTVLPEEDDQLVRAVRYALEQG